MSSDPTSRTLDERNALSSEPVEEYGQLMSGGGYHTFIDEPYIEQIYPLADRLAAGMRFGGRVYRRRIVVVEDWQAMTLGDVAGVRERRSDVR